MPVEFALILTAFITLFVIVDPIGLAPMFVALTQGQTTAQRRRIAVTSCLVGAGLLTAFGLLGDAVLGFAGISMPAFRIAGGILLFLTALDMLFDRRSKRREDQSRANEDDPSVFPLAIPLIAGPGAIATMILLTNQNDGDFGPAADVFLLSFGHADRARSWPCWHQRGDATAWHVAGRTFGAVCAGRPACSWLWRLALPLAWPRAYL
jgi:multiple antibiotic resistance protein